MNNLPALRSAQPALPTFSRGSTPTRALAQLARIADLRAASALVEQRVAVVKVQGVIDTAREAASSYTMLRRYADALSNGDVVLADELRLFTEVARIGAAEIVNDLVGSYCRESRQW